MAANCSILPARHYSVAGKDRSSWISGLNCFASTRLSMFRRCSIVPGRRSDTILISCPQTRRSSLPIQPASRAARSLPYLPTLDSAMWPVWAAAWSSGNAMACRFYSIIRPGCPGRACVSLNSEKERHEVGSWQFFVNRSSSSKPDIFNIEVL